MAVDDLRYEIKTVQVIRGMEARTKVKWEKDGWELVEQADSAMLRTKLTFRRPKKSIRGPVLIASGAVAAGILGLIILGAVTGSHRQPASSESSLTAAVAAPTTEPAGAPTPEMTPTVVETPEATSADGAQLEQAIKDAFGVKDFTEIHVKTRRYGLATSQRFVTMASGTPLSRSRSHPTTQIVVHSGRKPLRRYRRCYRELQSRGSAG